MADAEGLNSKVRQEKSKARRALRAFSKFALKRDVFFVHGWGDEANICWTYPYTEKGVNNAKDWEYTIEDWLGKLVTNKDEKVHFIKLVKDESRVALKCDAKTGEISIDIDQDESYYYENFFQFAELLKEKIRLQKTSQDFDIVCHSMGGLDSVAAIALDKETDTTRTIKSPGIKGVKLLITVSTPHQGSPAANISDTKLAEIVMRRSKYIRIQGSNMAPKAPFIKLVNSANARNTLLNRISFLHMFGGGDDIVVPTSSYKIKKAGLVTDNFKIYPPLSLARHSQVMGITQDPRMHLEIIKLLSS